MGSVSVVVNAADWRSRAITAGNKPRKYASVSSVAADLGRGGDLLMAYCCNEVVM